MFKSPGSSIKEEKGEDNFILNWLLKSYFYINKQNESCINGISDRGKNQKVSIKGFDASLKLCRPKV